MRKFIVKLATIYFLLLVFFLTTLTLVNSIPPSWLYKTTGDSLKTFQEEGQYPSFGFSFRRIVLDNFTDSLMFNTAYSNRSQEPLKSSLLNSRNLLTGDEMDQVKNLESSYKGQSNATVDYERYWHGYLIFLRPLMLIFSYSSLRIFFTSILFISLIYLLYLTAKKISFSRAVALLIASLSVDFLYIGHSIQFSQVFFVGIFSSLWFLYRKDKINHLWMLFFVSGALTSFFDLLTAPLVALGFLVIVTTTMDIRRTFNNIIAWFAGYSFLWFSKWIIISLAFQRNAVSNALGHVVNRTVNAPDLDFNHVQTVILNVQQLIGYDRSNKIFVLGIMVLALCFFLLYKRLDKNSLKKASFWAVIALIPYFWYLVTANHSYLHVWFTYRAQFLSVACGVLFYIEIIDWKKFLSQFRAMTKRNKE